MARAFVFPGQGSQFVGMGKPLYDASSAARAVFEEVDEALGEKLSALIFEGPEEDLKLTRNTQPALMTVSLAVVAAFKEMGGDIQSAASAVAGHSLGEYSALAAAGSLSIKDTARLLRLRGDSMQAAVPVGEGAMAAVLGLDLESVRSIAEEAEAEGGVCAAANDNAPGQVVISGSKEAVERAMILAKEKGAMKCVPLPVSAPFHCPLMQPAAEAMAEALESTEIRKPIVPLYANVTAAPTNDPDTIRRQLIEQVTGSVRWRESVLAMQNDGIDTLVEMGAGKVLSGLARRIDRSLNAVSVQDLADIEAFLKNLQQ